MKNFFISYNKEDRAWAEWIAWVVEEAGYSVVIQLWDFRPGENFALRMQEAAKATDRTIAVLSENYLSALFTQPEWAAAFVRDPKGEKRILIPVRVGECQPEGVLGPTIYIDLLGRSEEEAHRELLEGIGKDRAKPDSAPAFPADKKASDSATRVIPNPVQYPGTTEPGDVSPEIDIPSNLPTGVPFFTGREDILKDLEQALKSTGATALAQRQAISGLGGIGKTQTAIEYARRHQREYKAVLWAVAESREALISDFVSIARVLELPEANVQDQSSVVEAVKEWLETNGSWLLILDNIDNPGIVEEFLPDSPNGHLLLTSRAQVFDTLGILNPIELDEMLPDDARDFLLKRTGRHDLKDNEANAIEQLAKELDYLPLALEQAGAYIKELRGSFADYLVSYYRRGLELLEKGQPTGKYHKSVRTTWSLNFQQVEQASVASAQLLRLSAFLSSDRIPVELISCGSRELGRELSKALAEVNVDPLVLDELFQPLIQYSLIHRDRESKTYDIHRLVQAVLKEAMDESTKRAWATRAVQSVALIFPDVDAIEPSDWDRIERLLVHAQACVGLIDAWKLGSAEAAQLLDLSGRYLHMRGRLGEAESRYQDSLTIRERVPGAEHPDVAKSLHNLAWLRFDQGRFREAEPLYVRSLSIREKTFGHGSPLVATTLAMLGRLYVEQARYSEAEDLLQRSLNIREKTFGDKHKSLVNSLADLGKLYMDRGKFSEAEDFLVRGLNISEELLEQTHPETARILSALGWLKLAWGKRILEAEELFVRSIRMYETLLGANYPGVSSALSGLAQVQVLRDRLDQAEQILTQALNAVEGTLGKDSVISLTPLNCLCGLYIRQKRYSDAEQICDRQISITEKAVGPEHPGTALSLVNMGAVAYYQRNYVRGEQLIQRAIPILTNAFGMDHPHVLHAITVQAAILKGMNRKGEAQRLEGQARKIQGKLDRKKPKKH